MVCLWEIRVSSVPWTSKVGLAIFSALALLSKPYLRIEEARVPYRSLTASHKERKGESRMRAPTGKRLAR